LDDLGHTYTALLRTLETLRTQLAMTAPSDPARDALYRDMLSCYHELFVILRRRITARQARLAVRPKD
jgi:hypothetical protein